MQESHFSVDVFQILLTILNSLQSELASQRSKLDVTHIHESHSKAGGTFHAMILPTTEKDRTILVK